MNTPDAKLGDGDGKSESLRWPHGDAVIEEILARCHQSEALKVIDELILHVETMGIASRFKRNRYANQALTMHEATPPLGLTDFIVGKGRKLSEVGHKRATLLVELRRIRSELMLVFSRLASIRLEIEVTNMEDDGSHVPMPSAQDRERQNLFQAADILQ